MYKPTIELRLKNNIEIKRNNTSKITPLKGLLIGPLPISGDVCGGAKVSFAQMKGHLSLQSNISWEVVNTARPFIRYGILFRGVLNGLTFLKVLLEIIYKARSKRIAVVNISTNGVKTVGVAVWLITKLYGLPLAVRVFGGNFGEYYDNLSPTLRYLINNTIIKADLLLLQTKGLCEKFSNSRVSWLPTSREMSRSLNIKKACKSAVFLGHIRQDKGVNELLEAARQMEYMKFDLYGAQNNGFDLTKKGILPQNVKYNGVVSYKDLSTVLDKADVLVLPTYYQGEGYPGVIIEAFQAGIPVIVSRWKAIPEIVHNEVNGLLVEPGNAMDLTRTLKRLYSEPDLYQRLSIGAMESGETFRAKNVYKELNKVLSNLLKEK